MEKRQTSTTHRYELPVEAFEEIGDIGMWVSRTTVKPLGVEELENLPSKIAAQGIDLNVMDDLTEMRSVWETSLHASDIRLRNTKNWGPPGWPHSSP